MSHQHDKTQLIEQIIRDVVSRMHMTRGDAFPINSVCRQAEQQQMTRNDVVICLQSLKNRHLLTADERFTDTYFSAFQSSKAA